MSRFYVAGPMRGLPSYNFPAFYDAAYTLLEMGHEVFNPAQADVDRVNLLTPDGIPAHVNPAWAGQYLLDHPEAFDLRVALADDLDWIIRKADGIVFLPGYENSSGAKAERAAAEALGLDLWLFRGDSEIGYSDEVLVPLLEWEAAKAAHPAGKDYRAASAKLRVKPVLRGRFALNEIPVEDLRGLDVQLDPESVQQAGVAALADAIDIWDTPANASPLDGPFDGPPLSTHAITGEVRMTSDTGGEKGVKPEQYQSIPAQALQDLAAHYAKGAAKYSDHNFRKGYPWSSSFSALNRHLWAFWGGEDIDPETGSKHVTAVAWHALTLATFMDEHRSFDDRYAGPESS